MSDITGAGYTAFLGVACKHFASFSLVWRKGLPYDQTRHAIGHDLGPHELQKRQGRCWPGTQLFGASETIITYGLNAETARVLSRPGSLFGWLGPKFPEDLAFYLKNGRCGFASVAHEGLAWILDAGFAAALPSTYGFSAETIAQQEYHTFDCVD